MKVAVQALMHQLRRAILPACAMAVTSLLAGCAHAPGKGAWLAPLSCGYLGNGAAFIYGIVDERMLACVERMAADRFTTLHVDTPGGDLGVSMKIADLLAPKQLDMVVDGQCNSSCANYFLPVASQVRVAKGGVVILHGGADESMLAHHAGASADQIARDRSMVDQQADFVARYGIARGWLIERNAQERSQNEFGTHLAGAPQTDGSDVSATGVLVDEALMRSCLGPKVEIVPFKDTMAQWVENDKSIRARFIAAGILPAGSLRCLSRDVQSP